jgi:programmed cell death protein 4
LTVGDIIEHTKHMLSREHGRALLDRSWGPGDGRPVDEMKVAIDQCLLEYLTSGDLAEAGRCIRELNAPFFFHEVVKRAVVLGIDRNAEEQQQISNFLFHLYEQDMLSAQQTVKGFRRLYDLIGDLKLDSPHAPEILDGFTKRAIADAVLPADFKA